MSRLKKIILIVRIWLLKRKAELLAREEHDRQYVVMLHGKPVIISKRTFKRLKHDGILPITLTLAGLKSISLYCAYP